MKNWRMCAPAAFNIFLLYTTSTLYCSYYARKISLKCYLLQLVPAHMTLERIEFRIEITVYSVRFTWMTEKRFGY